MRLRKLIPSLCVIAMIAVPLSSQNQENGKFTILIDEIDRVGHTCVVEATSEKITYKLMARLPGACAILAAGAEYEAYRETPGNGPKDEAEDSPTIIILNNGDNKRRANPVFDIVSEKLVKLKPCPTDDQVGLYSTDPCKPPPALKSK
jgi:hypothetical protein